MLLDRDSWLKTQIDTSRAISSEAYLCAFGQKKLYFTNVSHIFVVNYINLNYSMSFTAKNHLLCNSPFRQASQTTDKESTRAAEAKPSFSWHFHTRIKCMSFLALKICIIAIWVSEYHILQILDTWEWTWIARYHILDPFIHAFLMSLLCACTGPRGIALTYEKECQINPKLK